MTAVESASVQQRRFTIDEYYQMAESGILRPDERTELIDGVIYTMCSRGSRHMNCVNRLNRWAVTGVGNRGLVSIQNAVRLSEWWEPQPDVAILRPSPDDYLDVVPGPGDVLLLIEVAVTSLGWDRHTKLPRYAESGIIEVWIVDLTAEQVEVYREPGPTGYRSVTIVGRDGEVSPLSFPDLRLHMADIIG